MIDVHTYIKSLLCGEVSVYLIVYKTYDIQSDHAPTQIQYKLFVVVEKRVNTECMYKCISYLLEIKGPISQ